MSINVIALKIALRQLRKSVSMNVHVWSGLLVAALVTLESQFHLLKGLLTDKQWAMAFIALSVLNATLRVRSQFKYVKKEINDAVEPQP